MAEEKNKRSMGQAKAPQTEEFSESVLSVRRVAKVIKGGRRIAFSALVVVGDKKGSIWCSTWKKQRSCVCNFKSATSSKKEYVCSSII